MVQGLSCCMSCGIFPDQGLNVYLPHWQADSLPLSHRGSPQANFRFFSTCVSGKRGQNQEAWELGVSHTSDSAIKSSGAFGKRLNFPGTVFSPQNCPAAAFSSPSHVQLIHDPMDYSPPGSSIHGISQARILEGIAISFP